MNGMSGVYAKQDGALALGHNCPMTRLMQRKKLPIGIQTFAKIRGEDYYYVDKTPLAIKLIEEGS